jgi:HEAT repeat protein
MRADDLVQQLADKSTRLDAMRELIGSVNARELRSVHVDDQTLAALASGVTDPHPPVRFWSIQLLDHIADERAVAAIAPALTDPVPRVRRNAAHALGCRVCKPGWSAPLPDSTVALLADMARNDPNAKVRAEAQHALACSAQPLG